MKSGEPKLAAFCLDSVWPLRRVPSSPVQSSRFGRFDHGSRSVIHLNRSLEWLRAEFCDVIHPQTKDVDGEIGAALFKMNVAAVQSTGKKTPSKA
jgi:hypothetical protein